ncbi:MAG: aldo/keto reductase [Clostridia bacterium]
MAINQMNVTLAGKPLATMSVGCMRWDGPEHVTEIVHTCVEHGALYLDTSPMYCFRSEEENSERWVGEAIKGIREKVILSAKCCQGTAARRLVNLLWQTGFPFKRQTSFVKH